MSVPSNLVPTSISQLPTAGAITGTELVPIVQNGVTVRTTAANIVGGTSVPSTRVIATGTGLAGGGDLSQNRTLYIDNTGVVSGTYGSSTQVPILTINAQGQITAVSVSLFSVAFADITGKPTTLAGYGIIDAQPLNNNLTAIAGLGVAGFVGLDGSGNAFSRTFTSGTGINLTNGTGVSGNPQISLANTAVTPGLYGGAGQIPVITIDQQGRITSASQTTATVTWSNVSGTPTTLAGYGITDAVPNTRTVNGIYSITGGGALSSNIQLYLVGDANAPGGSKYYGTDASGTKGWYAIGSGGTVTQINTGTGLTGGPIVTTGTISIANTGVTAASYGTASSVPTLAINAQGQVTNASNTSIAIDATQITTGILNVARGGTGLGSYAVGDLIYASGATTLSTLADVATGNALISGGIGSAPTWGKIGLTTHISGTLAVGNGGTGQSTSLTQYGLVYGSTTSAMATTAAGTTGQILVANTAGAPTWSSTIPSGAGVTSFSAGTTGFAPSVATNGAVTLSGTLGTGNGGTGLTTFTAANNAIYSTSASALTAGTLPVAAGGSGATTFTANGVLYGNGTSAFQVTAVGTTGQVLVANTASAPSWSTLSSIAVTSITAGTNISVSASTGAVTVNTVNNPTFSTSVTSPVNYGGTTASSTLTLQSTTGVGTTDSVVIKVGNNGATTALTAASSGTVTIGTLSLTNALSVGSGGTGQTTFTANGIIYGNTTSGLQVTAAGTTGQVLVGNTGAAPSWATLSSSAVTSISFGTTGLTPNTATQGAVTVAGTLVAANGGTGQSSYTVGDILYSSGTTTLSKLAAGTANYALVANGAGVAPSYQQISLSAGVTGTLPIANGGTGQTTKTAAFDALSPMTTAGDLILGGASGTGTRLAIGANTYVLTSNGTTASWQAIPASGVTSISFGSTGLTPSTATTGAVTVAGTLDLANGGTGATTAAGARTNLDVDQAGTGLVYAVAMG